MFENSCKCFWRKIFLMWNLVPFKGLPPHHRHMFQYCANEINATCIFQYSRCEYDHCFVAEARNIHNTFLLPLIFKFLYLVYSLVCACVNELFALKYRCAHTFQKPVINNIRIIFFCCVWWFCFATLLLLFIIHRKNKITKNCANDE